MFPNLVGAFFVNNSIVRESVQTVITTQNDKAEIVITTKLRNDSSSNKVLNYFYPLDEKTENLHLYLDGNGKSLNILKKEKKRDLLFEQAKKHQDYRFFRLEKGTIPKLLTTDEIIIPSQETRILKLKYTINLDFLDDIFFKEIFLNDEIFTEKFELTLALDRPEKIRHFLPIYEENGEVLNLGEQIIWRIEKQDFIPKQDFKFFFSEVSEPVLTYKGKDGTYFAHFINRNNLKKYSKIRIIIDQSGSVYNEAWLKQQEILSVFLGKLSSEKNVKIIFWDNQLHSFNEDFVKNTRENQKSLINYFDRVFPMGKTDFEVLKQFFEEKDKDVLTVFLGDFNELEDIEITSPLFFLDFAENDKLKTLVEENGGKYLHIFKDVKFIKVLKFFEKFNSIFKELLASDIDFNFTEQQEFLPKIYKKYNENISDFFISRSFVKNDKISNNLASFLPKLWGKRKLKTFSQDLSDEEDLAKTSISRFFGIGENVVFLEDKPLYFSKNAGWEIYDFFDIANEKNAIAIAPFSEAQKQLFFKQTDKVAKAFGLGEQVNFCYKNWRCVSVLKNKREEALVSDLFFWGGHHLNHWANKYLKILADKNVLKISEDGNALPNQKITRGEFVIMAVEYKYGKDLPNKEPKIMLKDLDKNLYLTSVVNFLVNKEIIQGYSDQTFRPHRNLSRGEAVKILLSMRGEIKPEDYKNTLPEFPDVSGWESFWVNRAKVLGIVRGFEDGKFYPHKTLTKAEAAKLIVESLKEF